MALLCGKRQEAFQPHSLSEPLSEVAEVRRANFPPMLAPALAEPLPRSLLRAREEDFAPQDLAISKRALPSSSAGASPSSSAAYLCEPLPQRLHRPSTPTPWLSLVIAPADVLIPPLPRRRAYRAAPPARAPTGAQTSHPQQKKTLDAIRIGQ